MTSSVLVMSRFEGSASISLPSRSKAAFWCGQSESQTSAAGALPRVVFAPEALAIPLRTMPEPAVRATRRLSAVVREQSSGPRQ